MIVYIPEKRGEKMTEINQKIMDMIKQKKSIEEISNMVNLSYKQLYNRVSSFNNQGYIISKAYNTDGTLYYTLDNDNCYHLNNSFELFNEQSEVKFLVISDLHIGNITSDEEAINTIYNYCIKNDIHVIINCGDILDGTFSRTKQKISPENQVEYLVKNYPFDKSIYNFYTAGDHDESLLNDKYISLFTILEKRRHDICPLSLNDSASKDSVINLNNNTIKVSHKASVFEDNNISNVKLHLVGHNHTSKTIFEVNETNHVSPRIMVPPLSRVSIEGETNIPRAIELNIYLDDKLHFKHVLKRDLLILNDKTINVSETIINYNKNIINALGFNKNPDTEYVDDMPNTHNQTFKDSEEKEIGELSEEQKQKLRDFFGPNLGSKKLERNVKKVRRRK